MVVFMCFYLTCAHKIQMYYAVATKSCAQNNQMVRTRKYAVATSYKVVVRTNSLSREHDLVTRGHDILPLYLILT
jgi:hypothetical protein